MSTKPNTDTDEAQVQQEQEVGSRIRSAREAINLTQNAVSTRTRLSDPDGKGISRTALVGYENGSSRPGLREIRLLCEVLKVSANWLIFGTETAYQATLPSLDLTKTGRPFRDAIRAGIAISALKGHERDALLTLALSLAGRQLGDARLSGLLACVAEISDEMEALLRKHIPVEGEPSTLDELIDLMSQGHASNVGNRLHFDEYGEILGSWMYPDPNNNVEKNDK